MREFKSFSEMSEEDFRNLQLKELNILLYFDDFCKRYDLRYYLAGGTLIGALRHKGFIPWDEDIDVHMPRPDYEKLVQLWEQCADTKRYSLCRTDHEQNFHQHAITIMDNDTTYIMRRNQKENIPQGILLDIMPLDGCPESKIKEWIQLFWAILFAIYNVQRLPENQGGFWMRKGTELALMVIQKPSWRYHIWKRAEKEMSKYDFDLSPYVKELVAPLKSMMFRYPRIHFTETSYISFEGYRFPVQFYYKDYLENVYGNYMELPPQQERTPKTIVSYINLDEGYRKYQERYLKNEK